LSVPQCTGRSPPPDSDGRLHLIYFKGDPSHGDIFYVRSDDAGASYTPPIRVNSQRNSAMVIGTVRCPKLAVGRNHRVHVAWAGSKDALPKAVTELDNKTPMLYTRLNDAGTAFEPQRNVVAAHAGLDGGGSVAADSKGHVYVVWHAPKETPGEADRQVWIARSNDDGKTFDPEIAASSDSTGACSCCGLESFAGDDGKLWIAYRTATDRVHRDTTLLCSADDGKTFKPVASDPWTANTCVMSTFAIAGSVAAWETKGQIRYLHLNDSASKQSAVPGNGDRKHPSVAVNTAGDFVIVWAEGTGWNKGGRIAWQAFDSHGRPTKSGQADGLPAWSQPSAFVKPDGSFGVIF
jgi:hypothetical protein